MAILPIREKVHVRHALSNPVSMTRPSEGHTLLTLPKFPPKYDEKN